MSGPKIGQAKEAARFIINHLEENDRFAIIDFDDGVNAFRAGARTGRARQSGTKR